MFVFTYMYLTGFLVFSMMRKHLLLMLLSLEILLLCLFGILFFYLSMSEYEHYFSMIFLVFCVCESVLGLGILVSLIRTHSNDYYYVLNLC
uniref:NADH-ubiquinone oxidoreductase chain 4L n=1 Tax=Rhysodes sp. BMNH-844233 TaxID=1909167 RepID=A0A343A4C7_9CARA|nr:NADH dehydrogenase subunit 4L [Rhysodes sp. BMNH-844233]